MKSNIEKVYISFKNSEFKGRAHAYPSPESISSQLEGHFVFQKTAGEFSDLYSLLLTFDQDKSGNDVVHFRFRNIYDSNVVSINKSEFNQAASPDIKISFDLAKVFGEKQWKLYQDAKDFFLTPEDFETIEAFHMNLAYKLDSAIAKEGLYDTNSIYSTDPILAKEIITTYMDYKDFRFGEKRLSQENESPRGLRVVSP